MAKYNVNKAWPIEEPTNVDDCLKRLFELSEKEIECHGVCQNWKCICSSLDVLFKEKNIPPKNQKKIEKRLLETFAKEAYHLFPPEARRFIKKAHVKWGKFYNPRTIFIGRHYGLPTRCVDWTRDPFIALFFACRREFKKPGIIWWMDYNAFSDAIATQWQNAYGKEKNILGNFEEAFTNGEIKKVLIRLHYLCLLDRPNKQNAHIILCDIYNVHHDKKIYHLMIRRNKTKDRERGRIIIKPRMKVDLLHELDRLGINGTTLGIEELCVESIAADVADKFGLGK